MNPAVTRRMISALKVITRYRCAVGIKCGTVTQGTTAALLRRGLIEKDGEGFSCYWKITDAGKAWIS